MSQLYKVFIFGLIFISFPLFIGIGCLNVMLNGFPIFFLQKRTGKNGKEFTLFKFRTMVQNAADCQDSLRKFNEANGPVFKIHNDPRLTAFGKFLNHTGLDELPQLFNVLFGTMAIIGPRPLPIEEAKKLKPWHHQRETVLPGIISPWILEGYHKTTFDIWMKSDIKYAEHKSFRTDCVLFFKFIHFWISLIAKELARTL